MKKLRSRKGMTFVELVTALLIMALVALAVASGVTAALRHYNQSVEKADARTLCNTLSQAVMDELRFAQQITGTTAPSYFSMSHGMVVTMYVDDITGQIMLGDEMPLVGSGAYNGMRTALSYTYGSGVFNVALEVYAADDYAMSEPLQETQFRVRTVMS